MKKALLGLNKQELAEELSGLGLPRFRTDQIYKWLIAGTRFPDMTNLPLALRDKLAEAFTEGFAEIADVKHSSDGTDKYLLSMEDGSLVESVLMRYEYGNTVCISTQAGCAMGCRFCASRLGGLIRNLTAGEILSEVVAVNTAEGGRGVTNVVLMGTGEPFNNYENTVSAIRLMHGEEGLNISCRNISLSTCGLIDGIKRFSLEGLPVTLCLSLHSAFDIKRRQLMPIAERYTVKETLDAMRVYFERTGRRVIFEYLLIKDFNDTPGDIDELKRITDGMICHINLIPYNKVEGAQFEAPATRAVHEFAERLHRAGLSATVRRSLGRDIDGACGQLRAKAMGLKEE